MQAASTFSFNINKEIGGNSAVLYRRSYIQHLTTSHVKLQTQIWDLAWKQNIQRKKVERTIIPAPSGKKWLRDSLPGTEMKLVWIWTELICQHYHLCSSRSLARRQASAVDILLQSNCLEDMSVSHDLAKGKLCTYHPLSDLSAGHGSLLPISPPSFRPPPPLLFSHIGSFFPHIHVPLIPHLMIDHFELREKHTWFLAQALNHIFLCVLYSYLDDQRSSAQTRCIFM